MNKRSSKKFYQEMFQLLHLPKNGESKTLHYDVTNF